MKKLFIIILSSFLFANSYNFAKNILGEKFEIYKDLIKSSLEENATLKQTLIFLKSNGLINLYFKNIKTIHPKFIFTNENSIFDTKILYSILKNMGYYNFYPIAIAKDTNYSLTIETVSQNYIDPLNLLNELKKRGCNLFNIKKENNFIYYIKCFNEKIFHTYTLKKDIQALHNINGIYWINPNNFKKIYIATSKYDFWHPYVAFYDKNLNILNIISLSDLIRKQILNIPKKCKYIKITDTFTKENIKRGIFIKGLK